MRILLFLITYVYYKARFKKRKVFLNYRYRHQKQAQYHIQFAVSHPALTTYKGIFFPFQHRHSPTYAAVTFRKAWHKSNFAHRGTYYAYGELRTYVCIYITKSNWYPEHRNLIGHNMRAQPPVLSPNSILPPPSSHGVFFPVMGGGGGGGGDGSHL